MTEQLVLLQTEPPAWKIDERTRATGLAAIAQARATLLGTTPTSLDNHPIRTAA